MEEICDIRKDKDAFLNKFDIHMDYDTNIFDFERDGEYLIDNLMKYAPYGKDFEPPRILLSFKRQHGMIKPMKDNQHTKILLAPAFSCLLWNTSPEEVTSIDGTDTVYLTGRLSKSVFMGEWTTNFVAQAIG